MLGRGSGDGHLTGQQIDRTRTPASDPLAERYTKRRGLGTRYVNQLRALLTDEQFAALPGARRYLSPEQVAAGRAGNRRSLKDLNPESGRAPAPTPDGLGEIPGAGEKKKKGRGPRTRGAG